MGPTGLWVVSTTTPTHLTLFLRCGQSNSNGGISSQVQNAITGYKNAAATNATNQALNDDARRKNNENSNLNAGYNRVLKIADNTAGGDYTTQRKLIRDITGVPQSVKDNFEKDYKTFYQTEKLVAWDNKQGAVDPWESLTASGITDKKKNYKINGKLPKQMTTLILPRATATPGTGRGLTTQHKEKQLVNVAGC